MNEERRSESFLAALMKIEKVRSFTVKFAVFMTYGLVMNLVEEEAVCYIILFFVIVSLCISRFFQGGKK